MNQKLRALFISSRPISWINTAYPFAAGYGLTFHHIDRTLLIGTFFFLIPYNVLMYSVNDVFDYESDIRNPRKGGIEGALLKKPWHPFILWSAGLICLPFIIYLFGLGSTAAKLFLAYALFMQLAYTLPKLRFKEKPGLDSFTSSTHFVSPLVYALLLHGWQNSYWPIVVAFFLWGMASHAFGAVQDIIPDKEGGIASLATIVGGATTTRLAIAAYLASAITLFVFGQDLAKVAGLAALPYAVSIWPYRSITEKTSHQARAGWKRFLQLNWLVGFYITLLLIWTLRNY